jgi:hypothetical protein
MHGIMIKLSNLGQVYARRNGSVCKKKSLVTTDRAGVNEFHKNLAATTEF